jgi:cGMP-dependent protein kinase
MIDFGTAKEIKDKTSTIIGTPYYMAPEVLVGDGYTFSIDYWSIAVCMYEFTCGGLPYGHSCEDPMDIYNDIINGQVNFPQFIKDVNFINLMNNMMCKNQVGRISNMVQIKNHVYFSDMDWDALSEMNVCPPYIPKISSEHFKVTQSYNHYIQNRSIKYNFTLEKEFDNWFNIF